MQKTLTGILVALVFALVGCATLPPDNRYAVNGLDTLRLIQRNPSAYQGKVCAFEGEVISAEEAKGQLFLQITVSGSRFNQYGDYAPYGTEFLSIIYPSTEPPIIKGHFVSALGSIGGEAQGTNAFGGHVHQVVLVAGIIHDVPCPNCQRNDYYLADWADAYRRWAGLPELIGIGIIIKTNDPNFTIQSIIPGSPADLDKHLKAGDRIEAVAQETGSWTTVKGLRLEKLIELIRGANGTIVRLRAIPANAAKPDERVEVSLVRKEIKLAEAK